MTINRNISTNRATLSAAAIASALIITACGGGSESSPDVDDAPADTSAVADDSSNDDASPATVADDAPTETVAAPDTAPAEPEPAPAVDASPEEIAQSLCDLVDTAAVASAAGLGEVGQLPQTGSLPTCYLTGPNEAEPFDFDRVLRIEVDSNNDFAPTENDLGIDGATGSSFVETTDGNFFFRVAIGTNLLRVENDHNLDDVFYDSPELRALAEQALTTWVAAQ